ncbi:glycosyltransferase family 2 protein [Natrinema hispanicum]|uniref:Glycosyltransferase involved in cell wall bisynthesis n=1 Tax=Natrinema hispanicum TaxID=392421 RepID=A0A1G6WVR2_9EURY|nr:glycosyltransferase family 2 protein [Natrinema hispanicum]SDD69723.1 Glycosyltransferase involved in cell wall bisynthesis [Natrinema hispanicum]
MKEGELIDDEKSVVAIIPAYNEEGTLLEVIMDTKNYADHVVVIDDSSTDNTKPIAEKYADKVISHEENRGVGAAVSTGYSIAIQEDYNIVVQIDADGQHDPSYIPNLLEEMKEQGADMVIGSRWLNDSHKEYSLVRRAGIKFFTHEVNLLTGLSITDVTSGFRAYNTDMLKDLSQPGDRHWALEQTLEAARKEYTVSEVSVPMPPATDGSQFDLKTFLAYPPRMIIATLKIYYKSD